MYAAGHEPTRRHLTKLVAVASKVAGTQIPLSALHSTVGRIAARAVRCAVLHEALQNQWQLLIDNIAKGDTRTFNRPTFPKGEVRGFGYHEAPRGVLSHWVVIKDGKIDNYQAVVPSTWNAGPRDANDSPGPYEAALVDNPVSDPALPLEVLRTVHCFIAASPARFTWRMRRNGRSSRSRPFEARMGVLVLGLGNILLSDEGVGVRIVEVLDAAHELPDGVVLLDGGTSGMELLDAVAEQDCLIVADAVNAAGPAGRVIRLEDGDIRMLFETRFSPHQLGLSDLLAALRLIGKAPSRVVLIGVVPQKSAWAWSFRRPRRMGVTRPYE